MKPIKGMALALAALVAVLIPGCEGRHSLKEVFYLVGSNMSSNYWQTAVAGFKKAAAQYQVTAKVAGPDNHDPQAELDGTARMRLPPSPPAFSSRSPTRPC